MIKVLNWPHLTAKLGLQTAPSSPGDESRFWNELFTPASESTPTWLIKLTPAGTSFTGSYTYYRTICTQVTGVI